MTSIPPLTSSLLVGVSGEGFAYSSGAIDTPTALNPVAGYDSRVTGLQVERPLTNCFQPPSVLFTQTYHIPPVYHRHLLELNVRRILQQHTDLENYKQRLLQFPNPRVDLRQLNRTNQRGGFWEGKFSKIVTSITSRLWRSSESVDGLNSETQKAIDYQIALMAEKIVEFASSEKNDPPNQDHRFLLFSGRNLWYADFRIINASVNIPNLISSCFETIGYQPSKDIYLAFVNANLDGCDFSNSPYCLQLFNITGRRAKFTNSKIANYDPRLNDNTGAIFTGCLFVEPASYENFSVDIGTVDYRVNSEALRQANVIANTPIDSDPPPAN